MNDIYSANSHDEYNGFYASTIVLFRNEYMLLLFNKNRTLSSYSKEFFYNVVKKLFGIELCRDASIMPAIRGVIYINVNKEFYNLYVEKFRFSERTFIGIKNKLYNNVAYTSRLDINYSVKTIAMFDSNFNLIKTDDYLISKKYYYVLDHNVYTFID